MFKSLLVIAAIASLGLAGCASAPGNFNGLGQDAGSMVIVHQNPYVNGGQISASGYKVAMTVAAACLKDVKQQQAGLLEVMATNGVADATSGFVGNWGGELGEAGRLGAHLVPGAAQAVGIFGATAGGAQGVVNGAKIKSGAVTNVVGNCANGDLHDAAVRKLPGVEGLHIYGSPVRTGNSVSHTPSWVVQSYSAPSRQRAPADPFKGSDDAPPAQEPQ